MRTGQLACPVGHGQRGRHVSVSEIFSHRRGIDPARHIRMRQQGIEFGSENEQPEPRGMVVIERLLAETVAAGEKPAPLPVVDDEGPHTVEAVNHGVAPLRIGGQQHLGIGMVGAKNPPATHQLFAQLGEVVDLAVEHDAERPVPVPHRLGPAFEIENAQTAVAEEDALVFRVTFVIRTAVGQQPCHAHEVFPRARSGESRDAAHGRDAG